MDKNNTVIPATLELLKEDIENDSAFASISLNPAFSWAKIVATDDIKNKNKQRIPIEEFDNFITTGINTPIKMAKGSISDHEDAFPIGTLTQMTKEGNKVISLAALWKRDRPDDVAYLKELFLKETPPNVSWEVSFASSEIEEDGTEALRGVVMNGLAIVGMPAYSGRTPFIAMSSTNAKGDNINMDELEQLKVRVQELESALANKDKELETLKGEASTKDTELASLREYKENTEKEVNDNKRLSSIREKFEKAQIKKEDTYFTENRSKLLELDDLTVDFMIQELVAFAEARASDKNPKVEIPNFTNLTEDNLKDPKALAKYLQARNAKK